MAPDDLLKDQLTKIMGQCPDITDDSNDWELEQARQKLAENPGVPLEDLIDGSI